MRNPSARRRFLLLLLFGASLAYAPHALSRQNGIPTSSCNGCHKGGRDPKVVVSADPARVEPGATTVITIRIQAVNGPVGGFYAFSGNKGVFAEIAGQGTRVLTATDAVHSEPRVASGADVVFQVRWTAPAMRGGVDFDIVAVSGNNNRNQSGDGEGHVRFGVSVGCDGVDAYRDSDGDGYGLPDPLGPSRICELGPGYTLQPGDCNDYNKDVHPGAVEVCNQHDDDCNGQRNEGFESIMVYPDNDRDGYGARFSAEARVGCGLGLGVSSTRDDCDDEDPKVNPKAMEICNFKDDNCNGRVDDGARATCGQGWCARASTTCDSQACRPGNPRPEECNLFDDDCDGVVDNGANLCGPNNLCKGGRCMSRDDIIDGGTLQSEDGGAAVAPSPGGPGAPSPGGGGTLGRPDRVRPSASGCQFAFGGSGALPLGVILAIFAIGRALRRS